MLIMKHPICRVAAQSTNFPSHGELGECICLVGFAVCAMAQFKQAYPWNQSQTTTKKLAGKLFQKLALVNVNFFTSNWQRLWNLIGFLFVWSLKCFTHNTQYISTTLSTLTDYDDLIAVWAAYGQYDISTTCNQL